MSKVLKCADLMPDCKTVIVGKDADEASPRRRNTHGKSTT